MKDIFELESENLSGLGGPMGTESTSTNFRKFFTSVDLAKAYAEKDYRKSCKHRKIEWDRKKGPTANGRYLDLTCSGDLGFVMYHITRLKIEA